MKIRCSTCIFHDGWNCRVGSKQMHPGEYCDEVYASWPSVDHDDWCGKWKGLDEHFETHEQTIITFEEAILKHWEVG